MPRTFQDLCSTCNNVSTCVLFKHHNRPVLYCELFDDYVPPPAIIEINTDVSMTSGIPEGLEPNNTSLMYTEGLCWDCENRETCMYRKREGGTWQCEEYL